MGIFNEEVLEIKNIIFLRVIIRVFFTKKLFIVFFKKLKKKEVWSYIKRKRFRKFGRYFFFFVKL